MPAKQNKASITKFLTTKTTDEMFNSPGQLAAAGDVGVLPEGGGSANGDRGVAGRRLTVGQVLGSARALGGRGGAGARARADRGLPRWVGSGRGGAERGDTRRPGASGGGRGRSGRGAQRGAQAAGRRGRGRRGGARGVRAANAAVMTAVQRSQAAAGFLQVNRPVAVEEDEVRGPNGQGTEFDSLVESRGAFFKGAQGCLRVALRFEADDRRQARARQPGQSPQSAKGSLQGANRRHTNFGLQASQNPGGRTTRTVECSGGEPGRQRMD